ncbi:hypothetical protein ACFQRB_14070 [Halobaculum litoreum]|uniref:Uncharacterized protein n=1 Tax=Halobaculum litoreum TaxID=3031998 RepID=A0ABD5XQ86_9EURY
MARPRSVAAEGGRVPDDGDADTDVLRLRFGDLGAEEQATVLGLDPLEDPDEYRAFRDLVDGLGDEPYSWAEVRDALGREYGADARRLGLRIANLGVADWEVWAAPGSPRWSTRWRATTGGVWSSTWGRSGRPPRERSSRTPSSRGCGATGRAGGRRSSSSTRRTTSVRATPATPSTRPRPTP